MLARRAHKDLCLPYCSAFTIRYPLCFGVWLRAREDGNFTTSGMDRKPIDW